MNVECCHCFHRTVKFECPKCEHKICSSCKTVVRKPNCESKRQRRAKLRAITLRKNRELKIRQH